ncbi:RDD family protein [Wenjunlia tyrosinilytica]|uniref:RDD domain-containing protein n=1 Tax=Wenjunlia tyrosinilytica TaxID=1544741 RepID=A0A918DXH2_9ACTN|nr:RDD family protein [Wenjunlia tyrosinilytica]GGO89229.1 hypothetical protein GCM10012280_31890 [Wenjunlia tyrosinilytica]
MSNNQPPPGEDDPYRKKDPGAPQPPPDAPAPGGGSPYDQPPPGAPPPPGGEPPPGWRQPPGGQPPPESSPQPPPSYGGGPYGQPPPAYGHDPAGAYGAPDPRLLGMPPLGKSWRRLLARIIDAIIVGIPVSLVLSLVGLIKWRTQNEDAGTAFTGNFGAEVIYVVVYFVYEGLMLARSGQTLGKMAMRIRVAMLDTGSTPTEPAAWKRAGVYSLPTVVPCCGGLFWLVNVLWHLGDKPYRQCLHDKAAKTVVVSTQ